MFDDNHWWYSEMKRVQLKNRLSNLPLDQLVVYSVGCVTHANEIVRATVQQQELAEFQSAAMLLKKFWDDYPQTVSGAKLARLATNAEEIVINELGPDPDEKFLHARGAEPILWATLYALTLTTAASPIVPAYSALNKSYFAIYSRYSNDEEAINEGRMYKVEKSTLQCVTEIAFQINYLKKLEETKLIPSSYSEIAAYSL